MRNIVRLIFVRQISSPTKPIFMMFPAYKSIETMFTQKKSDMGYGNWNCEDELMETADGEDELMETAICRRGDRDMMTRVAL